VAFGKPVLVELEVQDLARLLNKMGARISGIGTKQLVIDGVQKLHGADHELIPDRIEAGTYMAAAAITGGSVELRNMRCCDLDAVIDHMQRMNIRITRLPNGCRVEPDGTEFAVHEFKKAVGRRSARTFAPVEGGAIVGVEFRSELTAKQREILVAAYNFGYYAVPRKINSEQLAKKLGMYEAVTEGKQ
jgi:hypothetical protein